jgi:peptidoglycan/LPS O-acetylase OafA/YrhL
LGATYLKMPLARLVLAVAIAAGSLYVAFVPSGLLRAFNRIGDYSYGIYIYAFVVEITIHQVWPAAGVALMVCLAFAITLPLAVLSWHLVERPSLHWGLGS